MAIQTVMLEEVKERTLEEVLWDVVKDHRHFVVQMPDGEEVIIESKRRLKPLPVLEGLCQMACSVPVQPSRSCLPYLAFWCRMVLAQREGEDGTSLKSLAEHSA